MKVAVYGASGFVGATLVERLVADGIAVRPLIHTTGNAGRVARLGIPLETVDVLDRQQVERSLEGCSHVVNCSRGSAEVMIFGLRNLLAASRKRGISKFIHLSSVAVYGNVRGEGLTEDHPIGDVRSNYGEKKLRQDKLVMAAAHNGLDAIILCPPMIGGPYSSFLLDVLSAIRESRFALVEAGRFPCSLVDVENLAHAIRLALVTENRCQGRIFINDGKPIDWRQLAQSLASTTGSITEFATLSCEEAEGLIEPSPRERISLRKSLRTLVSSEVRMALRKDPLFASIETLVKASVNRLPVRIRARFQQNGHEKLLPKTTQCESTCSTTLLWHQLRRVTYSTDQAAHVLGYTPRFTGEQSLAAFGDWYRSTFGLKDPWWSLMRDARSL